MPDPLMLPDLPNVTGPELEQLKKGCISMLSLESDMFPGSQPVSFERKHLEEGGRISLLSKSFYAAEKTDGVRYMLLILGDRGCFAIDRNFAMKKLPPMYFPKRGGEGEVNQTLLDGELIIDDKIGSAEPVYRFLAYDACCVNGRNVLAEPLPIRLMLLRREVLGPRFHAAQTDHDFSGEPFLVELKDFFAMKQLPSIFASVKAGEHGDKHLYAFTDPLRKLARLCPLHTINRILSHPPDLTPSHSLIPILSPSHPTRIPSHHHHHRHTISITIAI